MNNEFKNLKKHEIQAIFTKTNLIRLVFNMIWHMEILKIEKKEQLGQYDTDKPELENKIPDTSGLVEKTDYNTKITEIVGKILDISNLAIKTASTTVDANKIPDVTNSVKKTDYNTKVTEIENKLNNHNHDKYIDTSKFNKLAVDVFNARLTQANFLTKKDFNAKLSSLNRKITQNKTKQLLVENELNKLKT